MSSRLRVIKRNQNKKVKADKKEQRRIAWQKKIDADNLQTVQN